MGQSITLRRRNCFNGDYGHVLKNKMHLFSVTKNANGTFNLLQKNRKVLMANMNQSQLEKIVSKFSGRFEINEGDVVLG